MVRVYQVLAFCAFQWSRNLISEMPRFFWTLINFGNADFQKKSFFGLQGLTKNFHFQKWGAPRENWNAWFLKMVSEWVKLVYALPLWVVEINFELVKFYSRLTLNPYWHDMSNMDFEFKTPAPDPKFFFSSFL